MYNDIYIHSLRRWMNECIYHLHKQVIDYDSVQDMVANPLPVWLYLLYTPLCFLNLILCAQLLPTCIKLSWLSTNSYMNRSTSDGLKTTLNDEKTRLLTLSFSPLLLSSFSTPPPRPKKRYELHHTLTSVLFCRTRNECVQLQRRLTKKKKILGKNKSFGMSWDVFLLLKSLLYKRKPFG